MTCLSVSTWCALAATLPLPARVVSLEQLHGRAALIGREVEIVSRAAIPVSDAPNQKNLIVIYPCGTQLSDETSKVAVLGRLSAQTVLNPSSEWAFGDSPEFKGRFRGILQRELIDPDDEEKVPVIELDEVEFFRQSIHEFPTQARASERMGHWMSVTCSRLSFCEAALPSNAFPWNTMGRQFIHLWRLAGIIRRSVSISGCAIFQRR